MINQCLRIFALCVIFLITLHPLRSGSGFPVGKFIPEPGYLPRVFDVEPTPGLVKSPLPVKAGLLFDVNRNKVVWEKGLYASFPIASLTKMMTALLIMEDIESGKLDFQAMVVATTEASLIPSTKMWFKPGQAFTVLDLLKSSLISSANDACYLLAQCTEGSEKAFVDRMNEKALKLGMYNSYFSNTTGLPASKGEIDNFSSPHDLLVLVSELLKHEAVLDIASIHSDRIYSGQNYFNIRNHNKLTIEYEEVDGLKTGYTKKAGFCIAATVMKEDTRLVAIVLGMPSPQIRNQFVAGLFDEYLEGVLQKGKMCREPVVSSGKKKIKSIKK